MKIEILFPECCNLFGDYGNVLLLKACLPNAEFIETALYETPQFVKDPVDLVYLGSMSEHTQEKVIEKLLPHKAQLAAQIEKGRCFLFTGNAVEVLFREIRDGSRRIPGLALFDLYAVRDYNHRYNGNFLGMFQNMRLLGCKTQFTMAYGDNSAYYFAKAERGMGLNKSSDLEGVHMHNFFGTYLVGPFLTMNPAFTRYLLHLIGVEAKTLPFENALEEAYAARLKEFADPATEMEKEGDNNQLKLGFLRKFH